MVVPYAFLLVLYRCFSSVQGPCVFPLIGFKVYGLWLFLIMFRELMACNMALELFPCYMLSLFFFVVPFLLFFFVCGTPLQRA